GFTSVVTLFFDGEFRDVWRKKRMQDRIANIKDHYIVCGAGEIGQIVSKQLKESKMDFLVIERNPHKIDELEKDGILVVNGDATHEEVLLRSNIEEAKGLVSTLSNDADNVFTVLTARQLNHDMYIVSKAIEKSAHNKLKKAGADNTISPNEIGGRRMAALLIRPSVISFLDVITQAGDVTLDLEEVVIDPKSSLCQKTLLDANIPEKTGLIIMAIKKKGDTKVKFSPRYNDVLEPGDTMVVLGTDDQVEVLRKMAKAD
ncbi:MAG TPA: potassium channel protein, partial [Eubacteriaceae bacterium]|nr:potassium channel protein [Eubacteriaceae bacterium]